MQVFTDRWLSAARQLCGHRPQVTDASCCGGGWAAAGGPGGVVAVQTDRCRMTQHVF